MQAELWFVLSRNMVAHQEWWAGLNVMHLSVRKIWYHYVKDECEQHASNVSECAECEQHAACYVLVNEMNTEKWKKW